MSSTTLMTFLLCTSPHVRSVKLLGSWDNFSKPYAMERDKRVGPGHWRGCHTFTNIICDGLPSHMIPARTGGLKMGGTYWYYYLLDEDVEHYNKAEPVTSQCPILPGQPVNVLHVPIILPDTIPTHTRERSPTAHRVERTMNPDDKYMNPREPPKPKLRLRTSPPLLQQPTPNWSFSTSPLEAITNRSASQPTHKAPKAKNHSVETKEARSISPPRSRGLRAAFRQWNASSPNMTPTGEQERSVPRSLANYSSSNLHQPVQEDRLHIRSHSDDAIAHPSSARSMGAYLDTLRLRRPVSAGAHDSLTMSIQERRALNAKTPDLYTPRNPLTLRAKPDWAIGNHKTQHSPAIKKALSTPSSSPSMRIREYGHSSTSDEAITPTLFTMNKRLPTLPSSPSSVMDEALRDLDARERDLDLEALASHFSDFTETESLDSDSLCERSRFSEWSTDTELISPESMTSSSTLNEKQDFPMPAAMEFCESLDPAIHGGNSDPNTPHLTVDSKASPATLPGDSPRFELPLPRLTITLSPSDLDIPGLYIDEDGDEPETNPKRHAALFGAIETLEGLGLVPSPDASALQFPEGAQSVKEKKTFTPTDDTNRHSTGMFLAQSATMKEMMDELSYLKSIIQSGASPDF
ncbi:hypothetical protein P175DRAFT_0432283 [Aspergillus ochraceoroseus IBT 24754]|uniref:AMP-activated protein kinase glycogen-binding domain-containing protein n=2 Tax=Aspergillus ochraceoroseus TaxID=138278 RepID=A0A2T5M2Y9_9EURO|nr:uncharacterized protein P175DRAFT_0432283 [Aspergillus ochraceoroseus IBT 24754]KKK24928.1 hypothetical protein AOCH_006472 [Aspergillus ochraceoroseus]PTU22892.1 hypothetical protein P175DRAFT_0432283 [Aspergillus ochraceoroseus IBT 24754]